MKKPLRAHAFVPALSVLSLAMASVLHAQTVELEPVVVTATRADLPLTDVIADVSIIDRAQLERAGAQSLPDVLGLLPGVQITTNGSYRSNTGIFLRGASSTQTILLINGIRTGSATSGGFSLENIPIDRIERIEVLRGAAAALYGPDAVGGVIQVFTREAEEDLQRSVTIGRGSDGLSKVGASLYGQSGDWRFGFGASHEQANGINVKVPDASGFNVDKDGFLYHSMDANVHYKINRSHALSAQWMMSDGQYDFDSTPSPNPLRLNSTNASAVAHPKLTHHAVKWSAHWTEKWTSLLSMGRSQDDSVSRFWRQSDGAAAGVSSFNTSRNQWTWQNDIHWDKDVLTLIAEELKDSVDSTTAYTVSKRQARGLIASYALKRDIWDMLATVRRDQNSQFGLFNTWAISGGYAINPSYRLVASVGTTFQAPTFNQLYWPCTLPCTASSYRGNPDLKPQQGGAKELGLRYQMGNTRASAVLYHNEVEGFIAPASNVQSSLATLKGVTLSVDQSWGDTALMLSYDHADPRLKPNNERVTRVARNTLTAQANHQHAAWKSFLELRLTSDREDTLWPGRVALPGYGLVNLGTSYQINKTLSAKARLNNVGDKSYALANGYTTPGRNLFVSINWND